jgi:hypothetical protein
MAGQNPPSFSLLYVLCGWENTLGWCRWGWNNSKVLASQSSNVCMQPDVLSTTSEVFFFFLMVYQFQVHWGIYKNVLCAHVHTYTHTHIHTHASKNGKLVTTMVKKIVTVTFCQPVTTFHEVEVSHINLVVKMLINMHAPSLHACSTPQNWVKKIWKTYKEHKRHTKGPLILLCCLSLIDVMIRLCNKLVLQ